MPLPSFARSPDQAEHLGLGPDVYPARRLVEEEHPGVRLEPARHHDLLLVAAREQLHPAPDGRRPDVELVLPAARYVPLLAQVDKARDHGQVGEGYVLVYPELEREPLALAVLGEVADADVDGVLGLPRPQLAPLELDRAAVYPVGAEDGPGELRAARPDEAGEAQDLARAHLEGAVLELLAAAYAGGAQQHVADLHLRLGVEVADLTPDHQADQPVLVQLGDGEGLDDTPVAHDGDAVGHPEDLVEPVRDVEDGDPLAREAPDDPEELVYLLLGQRRRGLVHDDDLRVDGERLGDLDPLHLGDA